jgi:hypothetical protein
VEEEHWFVRRALFISKLFFEKSIRKVLGVTTNIYITQGKRNMEIFGDNEEDRGGGGRRRLRDEDGEAEGEEEGAEQEEAREREEDGDEEEEEEEEEVNVNLTNIGG